MASPPNAPTAAPTAAPTGPRLPPKKAPSIAPTNMAPSMPPYPAAAFSNNPACCDRLKFRFAQPLGVPQQVTTPTYVSQGSIALVSLWRVLVGLARYAFVAACDKAKSPARVP